MAFGIGRGNLHGWTGPRIHGRFRVAGALVGTGPARPRASSCHLRSAFSPVAPSRRTRGHPHLGLERVPGPAPPARQTTPPPKSDRARSPHKPPAVGLGPVALLPMFGHELALGW